MRRGLFTSPSLMSNRTGWEKNNRDNSQERLVGEIRVRLYVSCDYPLVEFVSLWVQKSQSQLREIVDGME